MSIILTNMDMPKACCEVDNGEYLRHCPLYNICNNRDTIRCNYRPDNCPCEPLEVETTKYIVKVDMWTSDHEDYYDFEYSGVEHSTREEAEEEYNKALPRLREDPTFKSAYIVEVD